MEADGWIGGPNGVFWDKNINSQADFNASQYAGNSDYAYQGQQGYAWDPTSGSYTAWYSPWGERVPINGSSDPGDYSSASAQQRAGNIVQSAYSPSNEISPLTGHANPYAQPGLQAPLLDPIDFLAGGLVGGFRALGARAVTRTVAEEGAFSVYQGVDAAGSVRYIGITGRDPAIRFAEHLNATGTGKELLNYLVLDGGNNLSNTGARVWEQTLINQYGLQRNGGLLLNKINSIAPGNWWQYGIQ